MDRVIITGASAGLGAEFARQLAKQGVPLVLIARRTERLRELADALVREYGIDADVITCDFSKDDGADLVLAEIERRQWTVCGLINNAGFGQRGTFADLPLARQLDMIGVNVTSLVALTYKLLPKLNGGEHPFIINVASTAAFQAGPGMAVYYASKAFVLSFSEALHEELSATGITVSALCPGPTDTEFASQADMTDTRLFKAAAMSPEIVVRKSLSNRGKAIVVPGAVNKTTVLMTKISPRSIARKIAAWLQK